MLVGFKGFGRGEEREVARGIVRDVGFFWFLGGGGFGLGSFQGANGQVWDRMVFRLARK